MENSDGFEVIRTIPAASLPYDKPGITYTLVRIPDDPLHGKSVFAFTRSEFFCFFFEVTNLKRTSLFKLFQVPFCYAFIVKNNEF